MRAIDDDARLLRRRRIAIGGSFDEELLFDVSARFQIESTGIA